MRFLYANYFTVTSSKENNHHLLMKMDNENAKTQFIYQPLLWSYGVGYAVEINMKIPIFDTDGRLSKADKNAKKGYTDMLNCVFTYLKLINFRPGVIFGRTNFWEN